MLGEDLGIFEGQSGRVGHGTLCADVDGVVGFVLEQGEGDADKTFSIGGDIFVVLGDDSCVVLIQAVDDLLRGEVG